MDFFPQRAGCWNYRSIFFFLWIFFSYSRLIPKDFLQSLLLIRDLIFSFKSFLLDFESNLADEYHICRSPSIYEKRRFEISYLCHSQM